MEDRLGALWIGSTSALYRRSVGGRIGHSAGSVQRGKLNVLPHLRHRHCCAPSTKPTTAVSCMPHAGHCRVVSGSSTWPLTQRYAADDVSGHAFCVQSIWAPHSGQAAERMRVFSMGTAGSYWGVGRSLHHRACLFNISCTAHAQHSLVCNAASPLSSSAMKVGTCLPRCACQVRGHQRPAHRPLQSRRGSVGFPTRSPAPPAAHKCCRAFRGRGGAPATPPRAPIAARYGGPGPDTRISFQESSRSLGAERGRAWVARPVWRP